MAKERSTFILSGILTAGFIGLGALTQSENQPMEPKKFLQENTVSIIDSRIEEEIYWQIHQKTELESISSKIPLWDPQSQAVYINIQQINFESPIQLAKEDNYAINKKTFHTPEKGIATPSELVGKNIFVFGHSRWQREPQEFGQIEKLEKGDLIVLLNSSRQLVLFSVTQIRVIDTEVDVIPSEEELTLTLQTTASQNWEPILNLTELETKVDFPIPHGKNLALLVVAKPLPQFPRE